MKVPKSWKDITINQYRRLISIPEDASNESRICQTISILTGISTRAVLNLTPKQLKEINDSIGFVSQLPSPKLEERIKINGIEFGILPNLNALTIGEILDLEEYLSNWSESIHKLMAVIYRPIVKEDAFGYVVEDYDTQRSQSAAAWFDEQCSIEDTYGASIFFSIGVSNSWKFTKNFLTV